MSYLPDNCIYPSFLERYKFHVSKGTRTNVSVKDSLEHQMYSVFYRFEVNFLIWRETL